MKRTIYSVMFLFRGVIPFSIRIGSEMPMPENEDVPEDVKDMFAAAMEATGWEPEQVSIVGWTTEEVETEPQGRVH